MPLASWSTKLTVASVKDKVIMDHACSGKPLHSHGFVFFRLRAHKPLNSLALHGMFKMRSFSFHKMTETYINTLHLSLLDIHQHPSQHPSQCPYLLLLLQVLCLRCRFASCEASFSSCSRRNTKNHRPCPEMRLCGLGRFFITTGGCYGLLFGTCTKHSPRVARNVAACGGLLGKRTR